MGMSAPSLYQYFASRDALITALILDAFSALALALDMMMRCLHYAVHPIRVM
jgi:AcrR family transcriptional regulator